MPKVQATKQTTPKISTIPLSKLKPDTDNIRRRDAKATSALETSVKTFGAARSVVVDKDNVLRAGNGTLEAARAAGIKQAVIVEASGDQLVVVRRSDWSEEEAAAYGVADNRTTDLSKFDDQGLGAMVARISTNDRLVKAIGFGEADLTKILANHSATYGFSVDDGSLPPLRPEGSGFEQMSFTLAASQVETVRKAIYEAGSEAEDDGTNRNGRALYLICHAYLKGRQHG